MSVRIPPIHTAVFAVAVLGITTAYADQTRSAPVGFSWYVAKNKIGSFLRPSGWFVREEGYKLNRALFISKENFGKKGYFVTGLTVNILLRVKDRAGVPPTQYAKAFLAKYLRKRKYTILSTYTVPRQNSYKGFGLTYSGDNHGVTTMVNVLLVASNKRDILYILIFEAPRRIWPAEWKKGRPMLNLFALGK